MKKTDAVKEGLIQEIKYGILRQNGRIPTEATLVMKYKVSRVTVRRALKELKNEKILYNKPSKKGLFVNPEQNLVKKVIHRNIGILIHHSKEKSHPYMHRFLISASEECEERNFSHQIFNLRNNNAEKEEFDYILSIFEKNNLDGFLVNCRLYDETLLSLGKSKISVVLVNNFLPGIEIPYIVVGYRGIETLVKHLYNIGHRFIAFITGPQDERIVHEGIWNFQYACKNLSLPYNNSLIWEGNYNEEKVKEGMEHFLTLNPHPTAIIVDDDLMAGYTIKICNEKGLKVPEDVAIVGIGEVDMGKFLNPPLTTLALPIEKAAKIGVEILSEIIQGKEPEKKFVALEGKVIVRKSCGAK